MDAHIHLFTLYNWHEGNSNYCYFMTDKVRLRAVKELAHGHVFRMEWGSPHYPSLLLSTLWIVIIHF